MRIFVLGAGFSVAAGLPTAAKLLEEIINDEIKNSLQALSIRAESFEEILSKIDLETYYLRKNKGDINRYNNLKDLREKLVQRLSILMQSYKSKLDVYERFATSLRSKDVVLSFNYDLILESVLAKKGILYDYCYEEAKRQHLPLIKLHGSINHYHCDLCDKVIVLSQKEAEEGKEVKGCPACQGTMDRAIIPPTLLKKYAGTAVEVIWPKAFTFLQKAEEIYFIGYRVPGADLLAYQLFLFSYLTRKIKNQYIESVLGPKEANYESFQNLYLKHGGSVKETGLYFEEWVRQRN